MNGAFRNWMNTQCSFLQHRLLEFSGIRITWNSSSKGIFTDPAGEVQSLPVWPRGQDVPFSPAAQRFGCSCAQPPTVWETACEVKAGD